MGGLRKKLPLVYAAFLVGGSALAALPFLTAGFFSKDEILWETLAAGRTDFLIAGLVGAFLTSIYTFRLIFIVFHGESKSEVHAGHGIAHGLPLVVLLVLSTFVGALIHPPLAGVLPASVGEAGGELKHKLEWLSGGIAVLGILIAAVLYLGERRLVRSVANSGIGRVLSAWWRNAWGFDWLYDHVFVKPVMLFASVNRRDIFDLTVGVIPRLTRLGHNLMSATETGRVRWYAASIAIGAVLVLAVVVVR
jgi:NADH-quinone oxidoreductase subunit L